MRVNDSIFKICKNLRITLPLLRTYSKVLDFTNDNIVHSHHVASHLGTTCISCKQPDKVG